MLAGSVAKIEMSWDDAFTGNFPETPARQAWRSAVAETAAKAADKLPECASRVTKAVALVLHNDVQLLADGTARVGSQTNANLSYLIANGHCECRDFARAPHNFCTHRLSAAIARRAQELVKAKWDATTAQQDSHTEHQPVSTQEPVATPATPALPEAPASANCYVNLAGHKVQITLRDSSEEQLLSRMEKLLSRFAAVSYEKRIGWFSVDARRAFLATAWLQPRAVLTLSAHRRGPPGRTAPRAQAGATPRRPEARRDHCCATRPVPAGLQAPVCGFSGVSSSPLSFLSFASGLCSATSSRLQSGSRRHSSASMSTNWR